MRTYLADVRPLLIKNNCMGCHVNRPFALGTNEQTNFNEVVSFCNANDPLNSEFLLRNDGGLQHAGGAAWAVGQADRDIVIQWIQDGLRYN